MALETQMRVPFVDLGPSCRPLNGAILADMVDLFESTRFHYGMPVTEGVRGALRLVLRCGALRRDVEWPRRPPACTVGRGDRAGRRGDRPGQYVHRDLRRCPSGGWDPRPRRRERDPITTSIRLWSPRPSTDRTRFVVPVHLYGQMADMRALSQVADRHGLVLIEDACQAHGAEREGVRAGAGGRAAAFSFYPSKNLGAAGDAGAAVTSDDVLATRLRALRHHGEREKYESEVEGYTARLDTLQAIVLLHKLPHLDRWTEERRSSPLLSYSDSLAGIGDVRLPPSPQVAAPSGICSSFGRKTPEALAGPSCRARNAAAVATTRAASPLSRVRVARRRARRLLQSPRQSQPKASLCLSSRASVSSSWRRS